MTEPLSTRGERNNNPGNIDYLPDLQYLGELGIEEVPMGEHYKPRFARFDNPQHGIRAIARDLLAYQRHHKLNTIREFIMRWAPGTENDTGAYIAHVCAVVGAKPDDTIALGAVSTFGKLIKGIIEHENGRCLYADSTIMDACRAAYTA